MKYTQANLRGHKAIETDDPRLNFTNNVNHAIWLSDRAQGISGEARHEDLKYGTNTQGDNSYNLTWNDIHKIADTFCGLFPDQDVCKCYNVGGGGVKELQRVHLFAPCGAGKWTVKNQNDSEQSRQNPQICDIDVNMLAENESKILIEGGIQAKCKQGGQSDSAGDSTSRDPTSGEPSSTDSSFWIILIIIAVIILILITAFVSYLVLGKTVRNNTKDSK